MKLAPATTVSLACDNGQTPREKKKTHLLSLFSLFQMFSSPAPPP